MLPHIYGAADRIARGEGVMELRRRRCYGVKEEKVLWSQGGEGVMELRRRRCYGVKEEKVYRS